MPEFSASRAYFADLPHRLGPEEARAFTAEFRHYHLHRWSSRSRPIGLPGGIGGSMREPVGINEIYSITCLREYPAPSFENTCPSGKTIEKDGAERGPRADEPQPSVFDGFSFRFIMVSIMCGSRLELVTALRAGRWVALRFVSGFHNGFTYSPHQNFFGSE